MKKLALLLLFAVPLFAANDPRINEGIRLHDAGKYDEAIAKYKAVLADSPDDVTARYEMAYSYQAKGDAAACRSAIEPIIDKPGELQTMSLVVYGNCLDMAGDAKKAIEVYRKALKLDPKETQALYNLAVALAGQNQYDEARDLLKQELALNPAHGSGHYLLGQVFEAQHFRVPALLEYLRLLAMEAGSPRVTDSAKRVVALLNLGVEKKDKGNINLNINPNARTEEGDFKTAEMMLAIAAGASFTEDQQKLSEFERTRSQLASSIRMLIEAPPESGNHTADQNIPFFAGLEKKKLLDVFAGVAIASLELDGGKEWGKKNAVALQQYFTFMQGLRE